MTLMGGIDAAIVRKTTEEEIRAEVRRACEQYALAGTLFLHYIWSTRLSYPHVDPIINDEIDRYNKEVFGFKSDI